MNYRKSKSKSLQLCWIALALTLVFLNACEKNGKDPDGGAATGEKENREVNAEAEHEKVFTVLPHEPINGLLLTAEVLDEENWIIGLTWENVGENPLSIPFVSTLYNTIEDGCASPFLFEAYSRAGSRRSHPEAIILDKGRHADARVFDYRLMVRCRGPVRMTCCALFGGFRGLCKMRSMSTFIIQHSASERVGPVFSGFHA